MRVTNENIEEIANRIRPTKRRATDCETTGLRIFKDHEMFAFVIAISATEAFYFDKEFVDFQLVNQHIFPLFEQEDVLWFLHNSKFDSHTFRKECGKLLKGDIHDTNVVARLIKNDEFAYDLGACSQRAPIKNKKLSDVIDYCLEHGLWEWDIQPGKKNRKKNYFFHKVPKDIMERYTIADGLTTFELGEWQLIRLDEMDKEKKAKATSIKEIYGIEKQITKILQQMEEVGVQIDVPYVQRSLILETKKYEDAAALFQESTGVEFKDSAKLLQKVFDEHGLKYGLTEKGNASFKKEFLNPQIDHPIVSSLLAYRDSHKVAGSYYQTFLHFMDADGALHANIKQAGTATGRFSVTDPALQTLKKDEDDLDDEDALDQETKSQVRRCLVPREGYFFAMMDYEQMEYRVMLDYAGEEALIALVKSGVDIHQATADMVGITRKAAKTLNFCLLYGGGAGKIAQMLGISVKEANELKAKYFAKLPKVQKFIENVVKSAKYNGRLYNIFGRVYSFLDKNFAYKAPNYLIQGECSDVMRRAMIACDNILKNTKSRMILQIHDELLFEVHQSERHLLPLLRTAMIEAYTPKALSMGVDIEWSPTSWQDKRAFEELSDYVF